ncbi:MAG: PstS family phosphate ABC transporter substrate-binding protein [Candidatus Obscuribacterales bacterium]|nr:PstS family phosphate ABC transporter substrate-binding protein [Candidatus Obscuribacterales bacterium]
MKKKRNTTKNNSSKFVLRTGKHIFAQLAGAFTCLFVCLAALAGCSNHDSQNKDPRHLTTMISVEGSDTMMSLLKTWSESFKETHPNTPISMTTADSGGGIAALINGTTDMALSSRELTDAEIAAAKAKGTHLVKATVALDAIAVIVNPANPVSSLSLNQLKDIYIGKFTNWQQVGGKTLLISAYSREKNSGTYEYFHDHVMGGLEDSAVVRRMPSIERLVEVVAKEPGAVAYVGLGHALAQNNRVKIEDIRLIDAGPAVQPSQTTITNNYPLSRPLLIFTDENAKPSVKEFVDFCASSTGQNLVHQTGYVKAH